MMQVHPQGMKKIQIQAQGAKIFVPMRSGQKKISKKEDAASTTLEVLNLMRDVVKNVSTKELIELMRSEMAQSREQEMLILQALSQSNSNVGCNSQMNPSSLCIVAPGNVMHQWAIPLIIACKGYMYYI